ncbi:TRAP transporter small permease subunit [Gilvimarinus agarilyticus]|uniref:TRAP transporter small permease subunit n=1 Tax=unclassified Gilvimarinus TaxID=2642066 RepID=UPI001C0846C4|nr:MULTISPECIES: TRAP transporter small permease subunit [unclassified Gilvimarinus]MBU2886314.1 TRAP transporter small permease subunit [Gilvimarinus agarilyticus]MDO6571000.1 TRAP transporter small permease subunit [Gilvimarinus sp. 2_MG-2023]MDO6747855.1 TRAP transporter small permease subunit [Gilvimarinus sp. 1_MG-2023]
MASSSPAEKPALIPVYLRWLDQFTEWTGRGVAWLTLVMVVVTCLVVIVRRFLGLGSAGLQESVVYMHAAVFLLGAGFALKHAEQVRVDIFYRKMSARGRAWVDALGSLVFSMPLCVFVAAISWRYVRSSWLIAEVSTDAGGLPLVYGLKSLIVLFAVSLFLAVLAELIRAVLVLLQAHTHD